MVFWDRRPRHIRIIEAVRGRIGKFMRELEREETHSDDGDAKLKFGRARAILEHTSLELERCAEGQVSHAPVEVEEDIFECPMCSKRLKRKDNKCPNCGAEFEDEEE